MIFLTFIMLFKRHNCFASLFSSALRAATKDLLKEMSSGSQERTKMKPDPS